MELEARDLACGYGRRRIVEDFDYSFEPGKLYIILGKNGSGKSTLLDTLGGWLPPIDGSVQFDDMNLSHLKPSARAACTGRIAAGLEKLDLRVDRFVLLGAYSRKKGPYTGQDEALRDQAMEQMGIAHLADRRMDEISAGERQKAAIAQILVQNPVCLFLDEPGSNLDPEARFELMDLLVSLRAENRILIAVLHDLDLALRYGDELLVLADHHLYFHGTPEELIDQEILDDVFTIIARDYDPDTRTARFFRKNGQRIGK